MLKHNMVKRKMKSEHKNQLEFDKNKSYELNNIYDVSFLRSLSNDRYCHLTCI